MSVLQFFFYFFVVIQVVVFLFVLVKFTQFFFSKKEGVLTRTPHDGEIIRIIYWQDSRMIFCDQEETMFWLDVSRCLFSDKEKLMGICRFRIKKGKTFLEPVK